MPQHWDWLPTDEALARELQARLPARLYDAHAHCYRHEDLKVALTGFVAGSPAISGIKPYRQFVERQIGAGRLTGGLVFPFPTTPVDIAAANQFLLNELAADPACRGLLLVGPHSDRATICAQLDGRIAGFKVYHLLGTQKPTFEAPIHTYTPDWVWEEADRRGLVVMLHMVRHRALMDPDNQREIVGVCQKYPGMKLILAHAARGFHAPNTILGLKVLRGLPNVYFDTSGICEAPAIAALLEAFGPQRVMWGSDWPVSDIRGKCVTIGDNFAWVNPAAADSYPGSPAMTTLPVGLEGLRANLEAADQLALSPRERELFFGDTARQLLGLAGALPAAHEPSQTHELYARARARIPGGVHLLSKRPEMFAPGQWPAYYQRAHGCEVWDLDGRHYYDFSINGIGACLLGYGHPAVSEAVTRAVRNGVMASLNPPEEVWLAERLCAIHPWAEQVRLARTGGEVAAVAVRIARATTDRSGIAICGYHGWSDWYLAANLGDNDALRGHLLPGLDPLGVPRELRGTARPFTYNDQAGFRKVMAEHGHELAAVVMEPCRGADPDPGFLELVRAETRQRGIILIFDEITIGWRTCYGGAHKRFGVNPDMALFAKALGNGHPIAAVIGTAAAMAGAHGSFISSAYWTEAVGPAAALATLAELERLQVADFVARQGGKIAALLRATAKEHGLPLAIKGYPCAPLLVFEHPQAQELKALYTQLMLARGFLAGGLIYVTLAHDDATIARFAEALAPVARELAQALAAGDLARRLHGPPAHGGFKRLI